MTLMEQLIVTLTTELDIYLSQFFWLQGPGQEKITNLHFSVSFLNAI